MATERALSIEDRQLGTTTLITSRDRAYRDLDLSFGKRPGTNDVYKKVDAAAVKQSVKTLISCNRFEKPFNPDFGADIRSLLFELADDVTGSYIEENVRNALYRYEPRAELLDVKAISQPDNNSISVTVTFKVISSPETITFTTVVNRLR